MVQFTSIMGTLALTFAAVQAAPSLYARQGLPDPAGAKNLGNGQGIQFIGGQCNGVEDCASQCCATLPKGGQTIGVCSGPGAQFQAGKQGCGFEAGGGGGGSAAAPAPAAPAAPSPVDVVPVTPLPSPPPGITFKPSTLKPDPNGAKNVGSASGQQFITGECLSDRDCASKCCALVDTGTDFFGICSGPLANFQNGKQGCGFPVGGKAAAA
ncbi:hypothetical protein QBC47DRAFT_432460 [Echria macrotheca]|uniref:Biotrophy-associated secreted protein 2 n=1 Tax=Echria macrotheca TaxID=438768 RepID=A0AAJ0B6S1_9PEZI|nr:hypothetical protein QBC47DRAFT_432460 [Echria macrotheca]